MVVEMVIVKVAMLVKVEKMVSLMIVMLKDESGDIYDSDMGEGDDDVNGEGMEV